MSKAIEKMAKGMKQEIQEEANGKNENYQKETVEITELLKQKDSASRRNINTKTR